VLWLVARARVTSTISTRYPQQCTCYTVTGQAMSPMICSSCTAAVAVLCNTNRCPQVVYGVLRYSRFINAFLASFWDKNRCVHRTH
jgi:hypothetical protein